MRNVFRMSVAAVLTLVILVKTSSATTYEFDDWTITVVGREFGVLRAHTPGESTWIIHYGFGFTYCRTRQLVHVIVAGAVLLFAAGFAMSHWRRNSQKIAP